MDKDLTKPINKNTPTTTRRNTETSKEDDKSGDSSQAENSIYDHRKFDISNPSTSFCASDTSRLISSNSKNNKKSSVSSQRRRAGRNRKKADIPRNILHMDSTFDHNALDILRPPPSYSFLYSPPPIDPLVINPMYYSGNFNNSWPSATSFNPPYLLTVDPRYQENLYIPTPSTGSFAAPIYSNDLGPVYQFGNPSALGSSVSSSSTPDIIYQDLIKSTIKTSSFEMQRSNIADEKYEKESNNSQQAESSTCLHSKSDSSRSSTINLDFNPPEISSTLCMNSIKHLTNNNEAKYILEPSSSAFQAENSISNELFEEKSEKESCGSQQMQSSTCSDEKSDSSRFSTRTSNFFPFNTNSTLGVNSMKNLTNTNEVREEPSPSALQSEKSISNEPLEEKNEKESCESQQTESSTFFHGQSDSSRFSMRTASFCTSDTSSSSCVDSMENVTNANEIQYILELSTSALQSEKSISKEPFEKRNEKESCDLQQTESSTYLHGPSDSRSSTRTHNFRISDTSSSLCVDSMENVTNTNEIQCILKPSPSTLQSEENTSNKPLDLTSTIKFQKNLARSRNYDSLSDTSLFEGISDTSNSAAVSLLNLNSFCDSNSCDSESKVTEDFNEVKQENFSVLERFSITYPLQIKYHPSCKNSKKVRRTFHKIRQEISNSPESFACKPQDQINSIELNVLTAPTYDSNHDESIRKLGRTGTSISPAVSSCASRNCGETKIIPNTTISNTSNELHTVEFKIYEEMANNIGKFN